MGIDKANVRFVLHHTVSVVTLLRQRLLITGMQLPVSQQSRPRGAHTHSDLQTSLEGFYQESGRAGRDGQDADCILWYRAQDANRIITLALKHPEGHAKRA